MVDTASTHTYIHADVAERIGLALDRDAETADMLGIFDRKSIAFTPDVVLRYAPQGIGLVGPVAVKSAPTFKEVDGVLGIAHLAGGVLEKTADPNRMSIDYTTLDCVGDLCATAHRDSLPNLSPNIPARLGTEEMRPLIDTGFRGLAPFAMLKNELSERLWDLSDTMPYLVSIPEISDRDVRVVVSPSLELGGQTEYLAKYIL